ncbi:TVP38/TMEM64 family protein [Macrococcus equipercicus]|uniref:TVP38/TMEM64 family membrane protein n=1 Tax=Macrococcus equipercicus TaxID=69967 RepID=A0A9Q9F1T7_9STAP|nr:TVP38/TMEM64 family protein [Macrococcus equipercicus]KAA1042568.1 TVP38/TMEM64 family protein [Macrococcus equipercicus]UTH14428.1 TVP38/TMEM64 family protein [Macrococcus equipercicus]
MTEWVHHYLSEDSVMGWIEKFKSFGIIIAFLLPFLEAFFPVLPLVVFAVVNSNAYGIIPGFLLTWSGAMTGAYAVFLIIRYFSETKFIKKFTDRPQVHRFIESVNARGVIPLFILLCFPFTPSSVINIVAALSNIRQREYLLAVGLGKAVMLLILSFIGADIKSFFAQPDKAVLVVLLLVLLWWAGKKLESYYNRKTGKK